MGKDLILFGGGIVPYAAYLNASMNAGWDYTNIWLLYSSWDDESRDSDELFPFMGYIGKY